LFQRKVYDKAPRGNGRYQKELIMQEISKADFVAEILKTLPELTQQYGYFRRINAVRIYDCNMVHPDEGKVLFDFAAIHSIHPQGQKCCAFAKHILLEMFCVLHSPRWIIIIDMYGESHKILVHTCDVVGFWGDTKSGSKLNDERTHTVCLERLFQKYRHIKRWNLNSDNCGGQYKCKWMLFALAKLQKDYGIKYIKYLFAKQGQFKCCCDSYGFTYKHFQSELERLGHHALNAKEVAIQMIKHKHLPRQNWAELEKSKSPLMLNKGCFSADNFIHGIVSESSNDDPNDPSILFAKSQRGGHTRTFNITAIPHCKKQFVFYLKLDDQSSAESNFNYQSANLPVTCGCDRCRDYDFCEAGRKSLTIQKFTLKHMNLSKDQREKIALEAMKKNAATAAEEEKRRISLEEEDLIGRIVCVLSSDSQGDWNLGIINSDRISDGAPILTDTNPDDIDDALLVNPAGIMTKKGEHVVSVQLFKSRDLTYYLPSSREQKEVEILKASLFKRLTVDEVTWNNPGREFKITLAVEGEIVDAAVACGSVA
jgi:hypothetical protein